MRWRFSCALPKKNRTWELRDWFSINAWGAKDWDLSPDQWTSAKNLSPSLSQWIYCLDSGWTSPSLRSLPISKAWLNPSRDGLELGTARMCQYQFPATRESTESLLIQVCLSLPLYLSWQLSQQWGNIPAFKHLQPLCILLCAL